MGVIYKAEVPGSALSCYSEQYLGIGISIRRSDGTPEFDPVWPHPSQAPSCCTMVPGDLGLHVICSS